MELTIYTLPTCPICDMIKTKMKQKNISFEEKSFEEGLKNKLFDTDRAPVLAYENHEGTFYFYQVREMLQLINEWGN